LTVNVTRFVWPGAREIFWNPSRRSFGSWTDEGAPGGEVAYSWATVAPAV
jgi:hypothetical protein